MAERTFRIGRTSYRLQTEEHAESMIIPHRLLSRKPAEDSWAMGFGDGGLVFGRNGIPADRLDFGMGILGSPRYLLSSVGTSPIFMAVLIQDILQILDESGEHTERPAGVVIESDDAELELGGNHIKGRPCVYETHHRKHAKLFGFLVSLPEHIPRDQSDVRDLFEVMKAFPFGGPAAGWFSFPDTEHNTVMQPEPESELTNVRVRIYIPSRLCDAADFGL